MTRRASRRLGATMAALALAVAGCGGDEPEENAVAGDPSPSPTQPAVADFDALAAPRDDLVIGPLCEDLPSGDEPGAPSLIAGEPADVVLTWIPDLQTFEGAVRAAGLDGELNESEGVTILAPTIEAFEEFVDEDTMDDLMLFRPDELRGVIEHHIIPGQMSLQELREAGTVTSMSGGTITIEPSEDGLVSFDGDAGVECGDYQAGNARIHVISLPSTKAVMKWRSASSRWAVVMIAQRGRPSDV